MEFNLSEEQNLLIDTTKSFVKAELLQHEELLRKKVLKQAYMLAICQLNMVVVD